MALTDKLTAIGDAIREKNGTTEKIPLADMPQAIKEISGGGGTELNIAYGETAPEDTSKLWIKANEPEKLTYANNIDGVERVESVPAYLTKDSTNPPFTAKLGNKIYIFRNYSVYIYDIGTQLVTSLGSILPVAFYNGFCCVEDKKIYIFSYENNIYVFDTETNEATKLSTQTGFTKMANGMCKVGSKIYSFGGTSSKYIVVYDTLTQESTTLSVQLPTNWSGMCCEPYGSKIYLLGGYSTTYRNQIYVFDTETDTLQRLKDANGENINLPTACDDMCSCRIGTKIYLFGGSSESGRVDTVYVFDVETEIVGTLDVTLPKADTDIGCCGDGTKIYLFGGYAYPEAINVFTLTHELSQGNIEIEASPLKNKFNIINTDNAQVEIGVENVYIGNENNEAELCEAYLHNGTEWQLIGR